MVEYHVHVRSMDQFKQLGVREKNSKYKLSFVCGRLGKGFIDRSVWLFYMIYKNSGLFYHFDQNIYKYILTRRVKSSLKNKFKIRRYII